MPLLVLFRETSTMNNSYKGTHYLYGYLLIHYKYVLSLPNLQNVEQRRKNVAFRLHRNVLQTPLLQCQDEF